MTTEEKLKIKIRESLLSYPDDARAIMREILNEEHEYSEWKKQKEESKKEEAATPNETEIKDLAGKFE